MNKMSIIFFFITIVFLQNELSFMNYYKNFIEVEKLISNEDSKNAESELETLLIKYVPRFTKDYIIISQLCLLNKNKTKAIFWIKESMKYGAKLNCLKQIELLNKNITQNEWVLLKTKANELDSIYRSKINQSLALRINKNYQEE